MFAAISAQLLISAVCALVAGLMWDWNTARFFALGAMVAIVPNALFAYRLSRHQGRSPESYPVVFFLGEFIKIALILGGLGLVVKFIPNIHWLALLLGLIVAFKSPFVAVYLQSRQQAKID